MKKYKYILFIFAIAPISHLQWFNPFSILNSSDWSYWPNEAIGQLYNSYGAWVNFFNFGAVNIQLPFNLFASVWSLFANLGFSYDFAVKITFLMPIAILGFVSPYILFKKLTKNELISFVVALFYGATPYFLIRQTAHLPVAFIYAIAPLIIFCFIKALEKNKLANWLTFILVYWISICYEIRITYIVTFILFIYFVFFNIWNIKKYWKNIFLSILITIGLNLFWLLPTMLSGSLGNISTIADRGLFGSFLFSLEHAFNVYDSNWTGGLLVPFIKQPIIIYFWLIPLMAFSVFLFKNLKYKKEIIFFGIISLIGVFLTKQAAEPLVGAYLWLYNNFPGFWVFREASKFYLITAIGYAGLLGYGLLALKEHKNEILNKYLFIGFSVIILLISIFNTKPLITGEIRTMFIPRHIPSDYIILKDFISKQPGYFRTMYVPTYSRWGIFTNQKPKISNVSIIGGGWKNYVSLRTGYDKLPVNKRITEIFRTKNANELFDISSIKYVIIPIRDFANDNDFFIHYGGKDNSSIRDWYISELDKVEWLKKIDIGTSELVVYENENYKPHIYSDSSLDYYQTNASEFGDFRQNQNLYLNSDIEKNGYLFGKLDNVIVPIEAAPTKIAEMKSAVDKTTDAKERKKLQSDLDLYAKNLFFKDFKLQVPVEATYKIYLKQDSVLANNKNIGIQIDNEVLQKNVQEADKQGRSYFNQLELDEGEHSFKLYIDNVAVDAINSGDIVLSAENLAEPIKTPQLEYKQINPTKYIVNVHGASESFPLIFSESFHPGWKIYPVKSPTGRGLPLAEFNGVNIVQGDKFVSENNQGTIQNENLNGGKFYDLLFRKPVLDDKHLLINGFANAWWVDIEELEKKGIIKRKVDGIYDFSVIIEFEPQKYFYIGLLISGLTFLGCLGYLLYIFLPRVYNRSDNKKLISK